MERRREQNYKGSVLPQDYLEMVSGVFASNFDDGLKIASKLAGDARFEARGEIFPDEIVMCIALVNEGQLAATSVYASVDFDPTASSPTASDLLAICVDAIGSLYQQLLAKKDSIETLIKGSLSDVEGAPLTWTQVAIEKRKVFLKIDKSNPSLDVAADEWLRKNDPQFLDEEEMEQKETENLFVTGKKKPPGTLH